MRSRRGSESGAGDGVGRAVGVARSASKVGFGVTVAIRLCRVGLGATETSVGSVVAVRTGGFVAGDGIAVGAMDVIAVAAAGSVVVASARVSTTMSSGWMRGVAVGVEDWQANANARQTIAHVTSDLATACIWICG